MDEKNGLGLYLPNTGVSRGGNSATSVTSLYDDRKQADRSAVMQALADPAVAGLMERTARACKVKRTTAAHVSPQVEFAARIH